MQEVSPWKHENPILFLGGGGGGRGEAPPGVEAS